MLMLSSIAGSILSISYLVASVEVDIETSVHILTNGGRVIGYVPLKDQRRQAIVIFGIILFTSGYVLLLTWKRPSDPREML